MKIIWRVLLAIVALVLLFRPVIFGSEGTSDADINIDPVSISSYVADFNVDEAGALSATETITAVFPESPSKHGIFRFFDTSVRADSHIRLDPRVTSVSMDGVPVSVSFSREGDKYYIAKIGDPTTYVTPGPHVYEISYVIPGALFAPDTGAGTFATTTGTPPADPSSVFYWNVVASGWNMSMAQATATVTLPAPAEEVQCSAGTSSTTPGPCEVSGTGTTTVKVSANDIPPFTGMTVWIPQVNVKPSADTLPWPIAYNPVFGSSLPLAIIVALLTVVGAVGGGFWVWSTREPKPGFPVMYAPPKDLGPVQVVYMTKEEVGDSALQASLLRAADLNLVKLFRDDKNWTVQGITYPQFWEAADPVTQAVGNSLGLTTYGAAITADKSKDAGLKFKGAQESAASAASAWALSSKLVVGVPMERLGKGVWWVALVIAAVGLWGWITPTMYGLPFAAFVIAGLGLAGTGVGTRRTSTGRRLWSEAGGFQRMLSTPSSEQRFDFSARKDVFITYLPFAVAFGVAGAWAAKYKAEMNEDPPIPLWYPMGYYGSHSLFDHGGGLDSFSDSLSSTIGAYEASQRSSSSGGGGGFSGGFGGGGGGGGGGSW